MSWSFGNTKENRFEDSQNKKAVRAGLTREIGLNESIYVGNGVHKSLDDVIDDEMNYISIMREHNNYSSERAKARKIVIDALAKGSFTLSSKEEVRVYIKKEFKKGN